mgnify:CR=1 FL=1
MRIMERRKKLHTRKLKKQSIKLQNNIKNKLKNKTNKVKYLKTKNESHQK